MSGRKKKAGRGNYTRANRVELIRGGEEYFDRLITMIETATDTIHVQTYIFDDDRTGHLVADALTKAAQKNIKVFVMVDGYASRTLSEQFVKDLRHAGIQFRFFEPLFRSSYFYFGRRLHHKVIVTDTRFALVGGINIADRYNDIDGQHAWLDFALYIEGEAARELCILCWKTWNGFPPAMAATPCEQVALQYDFKDEGLCEVAVRRNDWVRRKNEISSTYVNMLRTARSHITILCSYFLPGRVIRHHLSEALRRGVKVKLITAGVSDIWIAKHAERHIYKWLLDHGVEIYEYQPAVLHGKMAICDGQWVTIGSYNINNLSTYTSIELNMNVRDEAFSSAAGQVLNNIIASDCIRITREYEAGTTNILKRFVRWFAYGFINLGLFLSTFYYKHKS